jgi:hypothetical protein
VRLADVEVPGWAVRRPGEERRVVDALLARDGATAAITTALSGAGGFGKTTLARVACADRRVMRRFGQGQVHWVTVGSEVRGQAAVAEKVNQLIRSLGGSCVHRPGARGPSSWAGCWTPVRGDCW